MHPMTTFTDLTRAGMVSAGKKIKVEAALARQQSKHKVKKPDANPFESRYNRKKHE